MKFSDTGRSGNLGSVSCPPIGSQGQWRLQAGKEIKISQKITRSRLNRQQSASLSQNEDTELVAGAMRGTEAIVIRDLRKTFGGIGKKEKVKAVQGVNLDIYPGEITAILGHNGAGTGHVVTFK